MSRLPLLIALTCTTCLLGCRNQNEPSAATAAAAASQAPEPTNRVDIPATVRKNLGITFAKVEVRRVAQTIRAPGRFEPSPQARREYRTMLAGRVELHVTQYERVEPGQVLYSLDSPQWRELQERLNETESKLLQATARVKSIEPLMAAHERHHDELQKAVEIWNERVERLMQSRDSGAVTEEDVAQVRASLATTRADLAEVLEKEAELRARQVEVEADRNTAQERLELLMMNAASLLGISAEELATTAPASRLNHPRWREIKVVDVRATAPGVVEATEVTNGAWVAESSLVLTTVQPEMVRFRAMGLQSDLSRFTPETTARIVPPRSPGIDIGEAIDAKLAIGLEAHPDERTITLIATPQAHQAWMRPGVSAFLEVVADSTAGPALAIPRSAVVKDGITHVFFRRDPQDPNKAIRVEADMGIDDGRWVVINSSIAKGDEVVLDGAYELKLATAQSGTAQKGGHFHADGAFHDQH